MPPESTYPRYWSKFPRESFEEKKPSKGWTTNWDEARRRVEDRYKPGFTREAFIQLVMETKDGFEVISEWSPGRGWLYPEEAAGLRPSHRL